jgi:TolA-binding protein
MQGKVVLTTAVLLALCAVPASADTSPATKGVKLEKDGAQGLAETLFNRMWSRLRALSPDTRAGNATGVGTQVAGIRGAESTGTLFKPYWKGDQTDNPDYLAELSALQGAQESAQQGQAAQAVKAYDAFLKRYPDSGLRPNAEFGRSLALASGGSRADAKTGFAAFVKRYPNHPLAADAQEMLASLNRG